MSIPFSRREVLQASGMVAATTVGGCLSSNPESPPGHIYLENASGEERRLDVVIGERSDGTLEYEIQARYRIPEATALEFNGVLEPDITHVLRVKRPEASIQDRRSATIDRCEGNPSGERVVSVALQVDGLGIITRGCEESYEERDLEYVAAEDHVVRSIDQELTTTPEN